MADGSRAARPQVTIWLSHEYAAKSARAAYGRLPHALLPLGFRRLWEAQSERLGAHGEGAIIALPDDHRLDEWDVRRFAAEGLDVRTFPRALSPGRVLMEIFASAALPAGPIRFLQGDLPAVGLETERLDLVTVGRQRSAAWGALPDPTSPGGQGRHLAGYASLSDSREFARLLAKLGGDLAGALAAYGARTPLTRQDVAPDGAAEGARSRSVVGGRGFLARGFNDVKIDQGGVRKTSGHVAKLMAEAQWLKRVPPRLQPFCAKVLDEGGCADGYSYVTEYRSLPTLAELYLFGRLERAAWSRILDGCKTFMDEARAAAGDCRPVDALGRLAIDKTHARLEEFERKTAFGIHAGNRLNGRPAPSLTHCAETAARLIRGAEARPAIMHGDFCFTNILYDTDADRILLIDPRGSIDDRSPTLCGDGVYDAAKLMHSIAGGYDLILAGRFDGVFSGHDLQFDMPRSRRQAWLSRLGADVCAGGVAWGSPTVAAVVVTLFLSMLPLHEDDPIRQRAFIANALRLHRELDRMSD
jgi:hypothetical protein